MRRLELLMCALVLAVTACAKDVTAPDTRSDDDLVFARFDATSQVHPSSASFWAVKGQDRTLEMRYYLTPGQSEANAFLEFHVGANSLLLRPDAQPFLPGDSVLITVTTDAQQRFIFTFEPSGLTFSPLEPAELVVRYDRADRDLDHDGDTDAEDTRLNLLLKVWQQQAPGLPWLPLPSLRIDNDSEVRGTVTHFTSFALAS